MRARVRERPQAQDIVNATVDPLVPIHIPLGLSLVLSSSPAALTRVNEHAAWNGEQLTATMTINDKVGTGEAARLRWGSVASHPPVPQLQIIEPSCLAMPRREHGSEFA